MLLFILILLYIFVLFYIFELFCIFLSFLYFDTYFSTYSCLYYSFHSFIFLFVNFVVYYILLHSKTMLTFLSVLFVHSIWKFCTISNQLYLFNLWIRKTLTLTSPKLLELLPTIKTEVLGLTATTFMTKTDENSIGCTHTHTHTHTLPGRTWEKNEGDKNIFDQTKT